PAADQDVIELTEVLSPAEGEDSDIIELTHMAVESPTAEMSGTGLPGVGGVSGSAPAEKEDPDPMGSLTPTEDDGEAAIGVVQASNEACHESDLLDFGDLELDDGDPQALSAPGAEALDEPEETLSLEDQEMPDSPEVADAETQGAAPAQNPPETRGLLDLEGFSMPREEATSERDEFSDIFDDLSAGANAVAAPVGQPQGADDREGSEDIGREMAALASQAPGEPLAAAGLQAAKAPEKPKSYEMGAGEEKFILSAGGISVGDKLNASVPTLSEAAQTIDPAAQASPAVDAPMVSPAQVEAALERVVRRMFSDRIEAMLLEVLEKAVLKEIQRIKDTLLDGSSEKEFR
ncbi:MAG: hypothetical protein WAK57_06680, partial [Desulfobacterales bacterium]